VVQQSCTKREKVAALIVLPEGSKAHVASILSKVLGFARTRAAVIGLRLGPLSWGLV
jgi:hypothetical protein